jgi:hypothetical protein
MAKTKDKATPEQEMKTTTAIATVLQNANIDTDGLVVPDPDEIDKIEDDVQAALVTDRAYRALHMATARAWVTMAEYASRVDQRKLWKHLMTEQGVTFGSFKHWCEEASGKGRTTVYGEMTLIRELGIPRNDIMRITKANGFVLLKVKRRAGASKITAELIEAAATMNEYDFAQHCKALLPGAAADEIQYTIKVAVPDSLGEAWKDTVEMLQVLLQTHDWEVIIEHMISATRDATFTNETGKLTALEGQTHWEAFTRVRETLAATGNVIKRAGKSMDGTRVTKGPAAPLADEFTTNSEALADGDTITLEDPAEVDPLAALDDDDWDMDEDVPVSDTDSAAEPEEENDQAGS